MSDEDFFNPVAPNDYDNVDNIFETERKKDKGYNVIYRKAPSKDGKWRNKKIAIYTSGGVGSRIRDAETGEYFPNYVGSGDEDLFFKVHLATGECRSANGSNTLFYVSPEHYASHLVTEVDNDTVNFWHVKRDERLKQLKVQKKPNFNRIEVR